MDGHPLLSRLVESITRLPDHRPVLVAIDGPDAAGKTTMADRLASALAGGRPTIRASVDGFHRPRTVRERRGALSPDGYYHDAFDYAALRDRLLDPLRHGDRHVVRAVFDPGADRPLRPTPIPVPPNAVLLFDGVFLQRTELRDYWDRTLYLHIVKEEILRRALVRDLPLFGSAEEVTRRYTGRYLPAQAIYHAEANPLDAADVAVDNTDPITPAVLAWRAPKG